MYKIISRIGNVLGNLPDGAFTEVMTYLLPTDIENLRKTSVGHNYSVSTCKNAIGYNYILAKYFADLSIRVKRLKLFSSQPGKKLELARVQIALAKVKLAVEKETNKKVVLKIYDKYKLLDK